MSAGDCSRIDDAGAYALHALDAEEAHDYAAHLARCEACQNAVDELVGVVDTLPMAAPQVGPPPELMARIMAVVQAEADLFQAASLERADRPDEAAVSRWAWLRMPRLAPLAAAGMACSVLAIGIGIGVGVAVSTDDDAPPAVATFPAAEAPAGADVAVLIDEDGGAELVASSLPAPPEGKVWQVWLMGADRKVRPTHALFDVPEDGRVRVSIDGRVADARRVMLTAEPPRGSEIPTGGIVVAADIS